ncbi:trp operon repressor [Candidatus Dojkabacteria bacterium]|nr:trp operon repressor [Candidatus Dojkabacteria bacterium]
MYKDTKNKQFLNELVEILLKIEDKEVMADFLEGLLTFKEIRDIPIRVQIVKMLIQGIPQREIAEELGVGIATVTRGSKELQKGRFKILQK